MSSSSKLFLLMAKSWGQVKGDLCFSSLKQSNRTHVTTVPLLCFSNVLFFYPFMFSLCYFIFVFQDVIFRTVISI